MRNLTLQTGDSAVTSGEILGKLSFAASSESDGGAAVSIGGSVYAQAENSFQSASNPTSLVFATAAGNAAVSGKIKITDNGHILPMVNNTSDLGDPSFQYRNIYTSSGYFANEIATSGRIFFANENIPPVGIMEWDDGEGTVSLGLKNGLSILSLGQQNVTMCNNGTASTLTKGQVVYVSGSQGQRPKVALALANSELTSARTFGVVNESIGAGAEGFVTTFGIVRGFNTSSLSEGSGLWLSSNTSGGLTMIRPQAPDHGVFVGFCVNSHASAGEIFVEITNYPELAELHNVQIISLASGDILRYDSSNDLWKNTALTSLVGATGPQGATGPSGGGSSAWSLKTTTYTAVNTDRIIADTSSGVWTLTLPAAPSVGHYIEVTDGANFAANKLTVARNGSTIEGYSDDVLLNIPNATYQFIYDGTTWEMTATVGKQGATGPAGPAGTGSGSGGDFHPFLLLGV